MRYTVLKETFITVNHAESSRPSTEGFSDDACTVHRLIVAMKFL